MKTRQFGPTAKTYTQRRNSNIEKLSPKFLMEVRKFAEGEQEKSGSVDSTRMIAIVDHELDRRGIGPRTDEGWSPEGWE